jgi:hypothetical protein
MNSVAAQSPYPTAIRPEPQDSYRILLLRNNGSEFLVAGDRPPFTIPWVEIPRRERVAEHVIAALRRRYGVAAICLFAPHLPATATGDRQRYQVMESREANCAPLEDIHWLTVDSCSDGPFSDPEDYVAITTALRQISEFQSEKTGGPFAKPGWIEELFSWTQHAIEPYGLRLTGALRQLNACPTFALLRLETNGPALWFKAVGEPNLREFPISVTLSRLFPGLVPTVLATRPAWHGWLATEFSGRSLDECPDASVCEGAAETLAELQIASMDKVDLLLEAGCRDLRATRLLALVDPFMEAMSEQMLLQTKTNPPALSRDQLRALGAKTKEALSYWIELNIPDTLGHSDFNPGNIVCSGDQCIFLDWAEACIGPPLMTLEYLSEHLDRLEPKSARVIASLARGHSKGWESVLPPALLARARIPTPLLSVFAYAVVSGDWHDPALLDRSGRAPYLRSLTRRMLREAQAFE